MDKPVETEVRRCLEVCLRCKEYWYNPVSGSVYCRRAQHTEVMLNPFGKGGRAVRGWWESEYPINADEWKLLEPPNDCPYIVEHVVNHPDAGAPA